MVAAALILLNSRLERQAIRDRALRTAVALSFGFDQEVAAVNYLLKGLSTSPALRSGDFRAFHAQLKATPVPDGSWLLLQDLKGQVVNTLRPYGEPLPQRAQMPNYDELTARLQVRPWTVSGRLASAVKSGSIVGLSLRLEPMDQDLSSWLTTILAEPRRERSARRRARRSGVDQDPLRPRSEADRFEHGPGSRIHVSIAGRVSCGTGECRDYRKGRGHRRAQRCRGRSPSRRLPTLLDFRPDRTVTVSVPLGLVNAPLIDVGRRLVGPGLLLLIIGGAAAVFTARLVQTPLKSLTSLVASAQGEVVELSGQLLSLQEEERRRIARELHDLTVQHLVATHLGLARLDTQIAQDAAGAFVTCQEISCEVQLALTELRIFTYLLHPPDLVSDGLASTLRHFATGFGRRSELQVNLRIPDLVDEAPPAFQLAILRVVQEALANIHRHAGASRVDIRARRVGSQLFIRISDDGQGIGGGGLQERAPLGVGIPGMRARLRQFNGDLRIATGKWGTAVLAFVPLQRAH